MSKKYRQRGYQDDSGEARLDRDLRREENRERGPRQGYGPREPRKVNMPGFRDGAEVRAVRTGNRDAYRVGRAVSQMLE